jgi:Kef-type K+ transport system membrane component KefB
MDGFLPNLLLVLFAAWLAGRVVARFGYPAVLGEIGIGILLGPPALGLLRPSAELHVLAEVGVLLMMAYIGMEVDPRELGRASRVGILAAVGGFVVPFAMGYAAVLLMGGSQWEAVFVGIAVGVTSLATKSRILLDLRILDTRIAHVMMAGALLADTLSLVIFAGLFSVFQAGSLQLETMVVVVGKLALFVVGVWLVGTYLIRPLYRTLARRGVGGRTFHLTLALLIALGFAEGAELAGLHGILGAFVAGMFLRDAITVRRLNHDVTNLLGDISLGFLAPVFFVTAGFEVSFTVFRDELPLLLVIIAVATIGKIVGTVLFYLPSGHGWREATVVGFGMNDRGAVEIIIAGIGLQMGIIGQDIFSILVFMAIFTTATVPVMLKWGVAWLERTDGLVRTDLSTQPVVVVGAGHLGRLVAGALAPSRPVTMVDLNAVNIAAARDHGLKSVQGDALDASVLAGAGAGGSGMVIALTPNPAVNVLVAQLARDTFMVADVRALMLPDSDGGLFDVLDRQGARPLFGAPIDYDRWERVAEAAGASGLRPIAAERALRELDAADPDLGAYGALPLLVRRGGVARLFGDGAPLEPSDEVLALVDDEVRPV